MHQVLVYADSLTWGIIPNTRRRLEFDHRWPGVMERELTRAGHSIRVIEDALNGRRTVFDDPYKPGRNGLQGLEQRIEINSPLSLVLVMLGTNDFQSMHDHRAWHSAQGLAALVQAIRRAPIEPGMPTPAIVVIAPPPIGSPKGTIAPKFEGADTKCVGLADAFAAVAREQGCHFFDAAAVVTASRVDGVHLDADQHDMLGRALAGLVGQWLGPTSQV
jgi:lysophospholipase L1-like esterase